MNLQLGLKRVQLGIAVLSCCLIAASAGAQSPERPQFRFERDVIPGGKGPNRLDVDIDLLTGAKPCHDLPQGYCGTCVRNVCLAGFEDLRLYDTAGTEIPYLVMPALEPQLPWRAGRILPVLASKKTSGFEVDLGKLVLTDRLRLVGIPAPFLKRVRVEGSGDRTRWNILEEEGTLFDLPDEKLRRTEIGFTAGEYRYLRVTWDDRSSARVPLPDEASARLPARRAPPPMLVPLQFDRRASEVGRSRFRLRLPGAFLPVQALELRVRPGHLMRQARVLESALQQEQFKPHAVGESTLRRVERGDLSAADLRIPVNYGGDPELELVVEDGDNPSIALEAVLLELAPLPWIYFESDAGESLVARFGDGNLGAPRYDLEAVRRHVGRAPLASARWGARQDAVPVATAPHERVFEATSAPLELALFRYKRQLPPGAPGLTALLLDAAVLAHGRSSLEDIRLVNSKGQQIPYVLECRDEPLMVDLPAAVRVVQDSQPAFATETCYTIELPQAGLPSAVLIVRTKGRVFEREFKVSFRPTPNNRERAVSLSEGTWAHRDPETEDPGLLVGLDLRGVGSTLELCLDEGDNSPLPLEPPRLQLPAYRVRFSRPRDEKLRLLYGARDMPAPRYDLQLLAPRLQRAAVHEVSLAPERDPAEVADPAARQKQIFWVVLIAAVGVLLLLLVRLVSRADNSAGSDPGG